MARGDGSVYTYRNGFAGQYYVEGKPKYVYGRTRAEARQKLREALVAASQGRELAGGHQTLGAFLRWYVVTVKAPNVQSGTAVSYTHRIGMIPDEILAMKLRSIRPEHIDTLTAQVRQTHAASTTAQVRKFVKGALSYAVQADMILRNPADVGRGPKVERIPKDLPSWDDMLAFIEKTRDDRFHPLWVLLAFTGMRIGEAFALEWADIADGRIHVSKAVKYDGANVWIGPPKSGSGRRTLEIVPALEDALAIRRVDQKKERVKATYWTQSDRIFTGQRDGRLLIPTSANPALRVACQQHGMPHMSPHWFRHAFITRGAELGIPIGTMQRIAGHSTSLITQEYYTHTRESWERDAMRKIGGVS